MPNGYTHIIYEDEKDAITFEDYMFECTRAFGARIRERDDKQTVENRKPALPIEPDYSYHEEALQTECEELSELEGLTMEEYIEMRMAEIDESNQHTMEYNTARANLKIRYDRMIAATKAWTPPTEGHIEFKDFMLKQLVESQEFDCHVSSLSSYPTDWRQDRKERTKYLSDSIERHEHEIAKAIERAESATAWLQAIVETVE